MVVALSLLSIVLSIVSIVCWVMVLIKMFGQSVLTGILGIICGLYALIWGFMNKDAAGLGTVMTVWGLVIVLGIAVQLGIVFMAQSGAVPGVTP